MGPELAAAVVAAAVDGGPTGAVVDSAAPPAHAEASNTAAVKGQRPPAPDNSDRAPEDKALRPEVEGDPLRPGP